MNRLPLCLDQSGRDECKCKQTSSAGNRLPCKMLLKRSSSRSWNLLTIRYLFSRRVSTGITSGEGETPQKTEHASQLVCGFQDLDWCEGEARKMMAWDSSYPHIQYQVELKSHRSCVRLALTQKNVLTASLKSEISLFLSMLCSEDYCCLTERCQTVCMSHNLLSFLECWLHSRGIPHRVCMVMVKRATFITVFTDVRCFQLHHII